MDALSGPSLTQSRIVVRWSSTDWGFLLGLAGLIALMYLFIAKSGFGYDATQYLAIGEDWHHGVIPYKQVVEVKPPGVFLLARLIMAVFGDKVVVIRWAVVILNLAVAGATLLYCRRWVQGMERWVVALGVVAVAFLMEMMYFLTEQPLAIFGAIGAVCMEKGRREAAKRWLFGAGVSFGVALLFKAVAMFYLVAALLILSVRLDGARPRWRDVRGTLLQASVLLSGVSIPLVMIAVWAWRNGVLREMLLLSVWVPLVEYPLHFVFLKPFLIKLGPLLGVWLAGAIYWFRIHREGRLDAKAQSQLVALVFAILSLVPLIKAQSSHYPVPAIPFLIPFIVSVGHEWAKSMSRRTLQMVCLGLAVLLAPAAYLYRDRVTTRLAASDVSGARPYAMALVSLTQPEDRALFIHGPGQSPSLSYLLTGLRPPDAWPYLAIDLYSYCPSVQPRASLIKAIEDQRTALVAWQFNEPIFYLPWALPFSDGEIRRAKDVLTAEFEPAPELDGVKFIGLWKRKGRAPQRRDLPGGPLSETE